MFKGLESEFRTPDAGSKQPHTVLTSGFCTDCAEVHSLPAGNSRTYALELLNQLETHQRLNDLPAWSDCAPAARAAEDGGPPNSQQPTTGNPFSTDYLWGDARGQMFGVLECEDAAGNTVVLKAFSCQYDGQWLIDGWAPPLFDVDAFHRLTVPVYKQINELGRQISEQPERNDLIAQRAALSRSLMQEIHGLYRLTNFKGETKPLSDILGKLGGIPAGTGDCCAPKLLNAAALSGLKPVGLSEFYFGRESRSGKRRHGEFYPACEEKCRPILGFMLCGAGEWSGGVRESWSKEDVTPSIQTQYSDTPILHYDKDVIVVCKPSGLLSVPGKGPDNQDCVAVRIKQLFPGGPEHPEVHRLDMDTSGLMVFARTKDAHRELSRQFHDRETKKRYIALLDGELSEDSGIIKLPFRLDVDNRPRQIYDPVHGKIGITRWKKLAVENGRTRVEFTPITGRTHQLRIHAASEHGLGIPIVGDRLYGSGTAPGQLRLHASFLSFTHPVTGKTLRFRSDPAF
jgi:tRNA pseudouridine32 synthase/23S rRNA pseudouridine746 synthase